MRKRVVAVFTGNRAEYGLQFPVLKAIAASKQLEYRLIVSGAHLDPKFGNTIAEIQNDGFTIHEQVSIELLGDDLHATAHAIGSAVISISRALAALAPDILVVYADRFEGFAAVIAGTQMRIPTAHIEGGDITEGGALDDSVRHAMTKLAHLHFTTNAQAAQRVQMMGEEQWRIHNVGFPAIDLIAVGNYAKPAEVASRYGLDLQKPIAIFTQHSVATQFDSAAGQVLPSLEALERLAHDGVQVIVTYPNNDAGGRAIIAEIEKFAARKPSGIQFHRSLGRYFYHGVLAVCGRDSKGGGVCAGNSSSGIKETPAFGCPAVDIGSRQDGRLAADNLIRVGYNAEEIYAALRRSVFDPAFRKRCDVASNPYGVGEAGRKIAAVLESVELGPQLITKRHIFQ